MTDHGNADAPNGRGVPDQNSEPPARRAATAVLRDISRRLDPAILAKLKEAALSPSQDLSRSAARDITSTGVRPEDVADFYIPAVAHEMGEAWCSDQMSFASVTIGTARLQSILRDLGSFWSGTGPYDVAAPNVLVMVPADAHHTLGALVLSGQLRRKGLSVRLALGETAAQVAQHLNKTNFSAMFISASQSESLESLRRIIDVVQGQVDNLPPITIGGGILEVETAEAIIALTGADFATTTTEEALRLCGIKVPRQAVTITKSRT